jgi:hypothetical protein
MEEIYLSIETALTGAHITVLTTGYSWMTQLLNPSSMNLERRPYTIALRQTLMMKHIVIEIE